MAAYGTLLSLTNTIDQILNHPRPPISLDKLQIKPLLEKVAFLQDFLENYIIDDEDGLQGRMVDAAHEAEDIIESHIAYHIEAREKANIKSHIADHIEARGKANISSNNGSLYRYLQKKIQKMTLWINNNNSLNKDAMESHIADHIEARGEANISLNDDDSLYRELEKVMHDLDSITKDVAAAKDKKAGKKIAAPCTEDDAMLGSDDVMNDIMDNKLKGPSSEENDSVMNNIMDKLTNQQSNRWIIAIAGMGGIGKTTLAKSIYENKLIVEYFDVRGWTTVSKEFDSKRILLQVLDCLQKQRSEQRSEDSKYEELGQKLYQSLYGRRYLIVMDDIWGTDAWDGVKRFFPNNNNGSRVLITTRPSNVALQLDGPNYFQMPFMKVGESWNLLRRCVFQEQGCPPELEEIGKDIAMKCRGLPLSIVVIGGLLAKSEKTPKNWQGVAENLSTTVNLEEGERCFRMLKLSYNQLPVHLKPCFLYMGMFQEDDKIHVPTLIKLWIDEGFVKPMAGKSLETIAREVYLHGLVIRNLIMVRKWGRTRKIKWCGIHDLLRDLCIKEAGKYNFFRTMETTPHNNTEHHNQISWRAQRRIGIHQVGKYIPSPLPETVQSATRAKTMIWNVDGSLPSVIPFRLLRILNGYTHFSSDEKQTDKLRLGELFHLFNLRHLFIRAKLPKLQFPPEFYVLWNLRTLILDKYSNYDVHRPVLDIWRMPQLRQVKVFELLLTDPPPPPMVLENLETLQYVRNLKLSEEVVERIPNLKKLGIQGGYDPYNLCRLRKLEGLSISCSLCSEQIEVTSFPTTLRKLTLEGTQLGWEEMGTKIGSLPYLESLKLWFDAFVGPEWETAEGGFPSLKYLEIVHFTDFQQWRAEATHLPRLERLHLVNLDDLLEIPLGVGDIPTLREIRVQNCSDSSVLSAKKILEEQEACYGEVELQIEVSLNLLSQLERESLSSRNFTVGFT